MKREVKDTDASTCTPSVRTARRFGSNAIVKECVPQAAVAVASAGAPATEAAVAAARAAAASSTTRRAISSDGTPVRIVGREARRGTDAPKPAADPDRAAARPAQGERARAGGRAAARG